MAFAGAGHVMIFDARHRLCRLAIAMRRYELEHGELPESFDDLAPTYMEEVPLDPSTEEPFKMENVEGGVRLYSAGIEAWDRNEFPGDRIKDAGVMVEMFPQAPPHRSSCTRILVSDCSPLKPDSSFVLESQRKIPSPLLVGFFAVSHRFCA